MGVESNIIGIWFPVAVVLAATAAGCRDGEQAPCSNLKLEAQSLDGADGNTRGRIKFSVTACNKGPSEWSVKELEVTFYRSGDTSGLARKIAKTDKHLLPEAIVILPGENREIIWEWDYPLATGEKYMARASCRYFEVVSQAVDVKSPK